jgi:hypothetical protein
MPGCKQTRRIRTQQQLQPELLTCLLGGPYATAQVAAAVAAGCWVKPTALLLPQPRHASSRSEDDADYISPVIFFFSSSTSLQQQRASDTRHKCILVIL